jgi:hypothetical protein
MSDESGRDEVYVQGFPEPRGKVPISTGGGSFPEWSPDGRELFYLSADGKLMAVDVKRGADSVTPSAPRELFALSGRAVNISPYSVAPDAKRFPVLTPASRSQPLELVVNWPALLKKETGRNEGPRQDWAVGLLSGSSANRKLSQLPSTP